MHRPRSPERTGEWQTPAPANGQDSMSLGLVLEELRTGQSQIIHAVHSQTSVLREIHEQLQENAHYLADRAATPTPPSDHLSLREKLYLAWAALVLMGAIVGKSTFQEAMQMLARPPGL